MNNWDDIRYFLAVARSGNVTAASRELGVNHSTVSRRIKALEERYGVRLFDQLPSGYKLTEDAAEVFEQALHIETLNQGFARKLQGLDSRLHGVVNITMPHDIFEFCVVEWVQEFTQFYPDIVMNMMVAKGLKDLSAREADIAIRLTSSPPDYLVGKRVCDMHYGIYRSNRLLVNKNKATPIITWSDQEGMPSWAEEHLNAPFVALKVNDLLAMYKAVEAGLGVARMPVYMHNLYQSAQISTLPQVLPKSNWGVWVLSHVDLRNTLRVQKVRTFLLNKLAENQTVFVNL